MTRTRKQRLRSGLACALGALVAAGAAQSQERGTPGGPRAVAARSPAEGPASPLVDEASWLARRGAAARLEAHSVRVDWNPVWRSPCFLRRTEGALAPPAPGRDGLGAIRAFLDANAAVFGVGASALDSCAVERDATTAHNGVRTIWLGQRVAGRPLLGAGLRANLSRDGAVLTIGSTLLAEPAGGFTVPRAVVDARSAVAGAARALGVGAPGGVGDDPLRTSLNSAPEVSGAMFAVSPVEVRPVFAVALGRAGEAEVFDVVIDATTGETLAVSGRLVCAAEPATSRVFTGASPTPMTPGPPSPDGVQPPVVAREAVTLAALDPAASPEGWLPPGAATLQGNNVRAAADFNADNVPDGPEPHGGAARVFDFPLDLNAAPADSVEAAIVQAFYTGNWAHDAFYGLGFTEAFGNYQAENFGRGGQGGDAIRMDVQDGGDHRNAFFVSSGADGSPGRVELFLYDGVTPARDSALDNHILLHELTHGLSLRLHGGLHGQQSGGLGEGCSDFFALAMLAGDASAPGGTYPFAPYVGLGADAGGAFTQNHYFGIRRYPYSTDLTKNPLSFADIDPAQFDVDPAPPRSPILLTVSPSRVHQIGEVWCSALWECRERLMARHGPEGSEMMLRLVVDAMKLTTTSSPTLVAARDAIQLADVVDHGGAHVCDLWGAFAKRGLGAGAVAPGVGVGGVVESFEAGAEARIALAEGAPTRLTPGVPTPVRVALIDGCAATARPETLTLWVSVESGAYDPSGVAPGDEGFVTGVLPAVTCGAEVVYFFSVMTTGGEVLEPPAGGAFRAVAEPDLEIAALVAPERHPNDFFGFATGLSGAVGVCGAWQEGGAGVGSGAAFVFEEDPAGAWPHRAALRAADAAAGDFFGFSAATDGDRVAIGAWQAASPRSERSGAAYVFARSPGGGWEQEAKLTALDAATNDNLGYAVGIDGALALAGAPREDTAGPDAGSAYVFARGSDGVWRQEARLIAEAGLSGAQYGAAVALDADRAVIGAPRHASDLGAAYIARRIGPGDWRQEAALGAPDGANDDVFGASVDISGDRAIVGAPLDDDRGARSGSASVFRRGKDDAWVFEAKLVAANGRAFDEFGASVSIDGDLAVIGARRADAKGESSGALYVFERGTDGVWRERGILLPAGIGAQHQLGISVALDAGRVLAGAWLAGVDGSQSGAAYVFHAVAPDCDADGEADACALASGAEVDADLDGLPNACEAAPADLNNDGRVDTADLGILLGVFGSAGPAGDVTGDRAVDSADLASLLGSFQR